MSIGLNIRLIYSISWFLKVSIKLNMKVVPNDNFKFGGKRVSKITVFLARRDGDSLSHAQ